MPSNNDRMTPPRTHKRRQGQRLTATERKETQAIFLQAFSMTANVRAACLKAKVSRNTVYQWAEHDETFSIEYKQAELDANDMVRAELFRRAVQGYDKPLVSVGKVVYDKDGKPMTERVYSDSLLSLLAKARLPEFKDKQHIEHTGKDGAPIEVVNVTKEILKQKLDAMKSSMGVKLDEERL